MNLANYNEETSMKDVLVATGKCVDIHINVKRYMGTILFQ
jgi:hypothetical protein